jgi:hypothetical protein
MMRPFLILWFTASLLFLWCSAAIALPVAAVAAAFEISGITAELVTGAINLGIAFAVSAAVSYISKALAPATPSVTSQPGGTSGKLQAGGALPRSFIVGRGMTAGSLVYANTYSPDQATAAASALSQGTAATGNTPNAYLVMVIALSDLPVTRLVSMWVNGAECTFDAGAGAVFEGVPVPEYNSANAVQEFDGTPSGSPPTLSIASAPNIGAFESISSVTDDTTDVDMTATDPGEETPDSYSFDRSSKTLTFDPSAAGHTIAVDFNYTSGAGTDNLWIRFYDGTQTTPDAALAQLYGSDPNRPYTSDRVGTGVAYAVVTALFNDNLFSGFPQLKFVLDGVKLYDRRFDSTNGGSGSQRLGDPSTWALSANPATIVENLLRGIAYAGTWLYGAQTVTDTQLPADSWLAGQNECDTAIDLNAGGTELQYIAGGEISVATQPADCIDELLKACNGKLAEIGGTYKIRVGAPGSAVLSFSDDDVLSTDQQTFTPFPSLQQTINAVTAKYISPAQAWNAQDAVPLYDPDLEATDGGQRLPVDISYSFVTSGTQVQRLMKSARDTERAFRQHALPMPPDGFVIEPLDVVSWSSTRNGYSAKLFDVLSCDDLPTLCVSWQIKEVDPNAYDWTPSTDEQALSFGPLALLRPASQPVKDWSAVGIIVHSDTDQDMAAIELSWDNGSGDIAAVMFEVRLASNSVVVARGDTQNYAAGAIIISQNLIFATNYETRGRYVPKSIRATDWSDWISVTTPDVRISITSFEDGLRDFVTGTFASIQAAVDKTAGLVASVAQEQDAANYLDKYGINNNIIAQVQATNASVTVVANAVDEIDSSFAEYQVTVSAQFATANASIETNAEAISSANAAFASYTTTTTATLDGLSATVTENATAVATVDGKLASQWTLNLDTNGFVESIQAFNDGSQSEFVFVASSFEVAQPSVTGGDPVPVFAIANVAGSPKIVLRGDMYADGTINALAIVAGTITADKIVDNSLTAAQVTSGSHTIQFADGAAEVDIITESFTATSGRYDIDAVVQPLTFTASGEISFTFRVRVDGVIAGQISIPSLTLSSTVQFMCSGPISTYASVGAGTHTVQLTVQVNTALAGRPTLGATLKVVEFIK